MAAVAFSAPEWEMDEAEAKKVAKASEKFSRHYVHGAVSQKTADTVAFTAAILFAYAPRFYLTRERMKADAAERRGAPRPQPPVNPMHVAAPAPVPRPAPVSAAPMQAGKPQEVAPLDAMEISPSGPSVSVFENMPGFAPSGSPIPPGASPGQTNAVDRGMKLGDAVLAGFGPVLSPKK